MRRHLVVTCALFLVMCAPAMSVAQVVGAAAKAKIAAILKQYPDGGPGLVEAIMLATQTADPAQQVAIGSGLGMAVAVLVNRGTPADQAAAQAIEQTMLGTPHSTLAAFNAAMVNALVLDVAGGGPSLYSNGGGSGLYSNGGGSGLYTNGGGSGLYTNGGGSGLYTIGCISPSRPGGKC